MNVLVLSSSLAVIPPARRAAEQGLCRIAGCWSPVDAVQVGLQEAFPDAVQYTRWDDLLHAMSDVHGCLACGDDAALVEAARQCALPGTRWLVILDANAPPASQFAFAPVWHASQGFIAPAFLSGLLTPAARLKSEFMEAPRRIEIRQRVPPRPGASVGLSEEEIERHLFQIIPVLRFLAGEFQEVTSLRIGQRGETSDQAFVTFSRDDALDASWRLERGEPRCELRLQGAGGQILEAEWNPVQTGADDIEAEFRGFGREPDPAPVYQWTDLHRCGELAVAAKNSLRRQRTIRLQPEEGTERSQFKSQMTALGCGVLSWVLLGSVLILFSAAVLDPRDREYKASAQQEFVFRVQDFQDQQPELTAAGQAKLQEVARRWTQTEAAVIVEQDDAGHAELDSRRRKQIRTHLSKTGLREVESRVITRPLSGRLFEALMRFGWLAVFVPLLLFVSAQAFIAAAREKH